MMVLGGFLIGLALFTGCMCRSNRATVADEMFWLRIGAVLLIAAVAFGVFLEVAL